jgi:hypothetical protein
MNFLTKSTSCFGNSTTLLVSFWLAQSERLSAETRIENPSFSGRFQTGWNNIYSDIILRREESKRAKVFLISNYGKGDASRKD